MESLDAFLSLLTPWFDEIGLPAHLRPILYEKVKNDVFDASEFAISVVEDEEADPDKSDSEEREAPTDDAVSEPSAHSDDTVRTQRVLAAVTEVEPCKDVWLIDHAWTFKYREARYQLLQNVKLRQRVAAMLGMTIAEHSNDEDGAEDAAVQREVQIMFENLWRLVGSYRPAPKGRSLQEMEDTDHDSIWYVMDELGSAVDKSPLCIRTVDTEEEEDRVNMAMHTMPVMFPEKGCVYTIMWATKHISAFEMCVAKGRYGVGGVATDDHNLSTIVASHVLYNDALSPKEAPTAFFAHGESGADEDEDEEDSSNERDCKQLIKDCVDAFKTRHTRMTLASVTPSPSPSADPVHFPTIDSPQSLATHTQRTFPLKFYTDSNLVLTYVTDEQHFQLVATPDEADIVWMAHYAMRRSDEFPNALFVSQLPEERFFTNKRELAKIVQKRVGYRPWFQVTYDAMTELPAFVADFWAREQLIKEKKSHHHHSISSITNDSEGPQTRSLQRGMSTSDIRCDDGTNLWIAKPCNLARSIDMTVSNNLPWLLRVAETGPKIFCKYIATPSTLRGRKFDLRFVVAVRSLLTHETSLEAYLYNVFWTRFAAEQYSLDSFDVYAKHWTVMNYANPEKLLQLHYNDFIPEFDAQYELKMPSKCSSAWQTIVYPKVLQMMRELLLSIEPDDISHKRFRGAYGVDVMIREETNSNGEVIDLHPVLLEVTFSPDCHRACKYHPHFFNDLFQTLFLGSPQNMTPL